MSGSKLTAPAFVFLAIAAIGIAGGIWFVAGNAIQRWQIQRVIHSLTLKFPVGTEFSAAKRAVDAAYPRSSTTYTPTECEKSSHYGVPAYNSEDGPCIFGMVDVSGPYVMEAVVQFKLIFGPDNLLKRLYTDPVYTFL
jgi:hypothetical protein